FTGDASGDWLYRALHRWGFANQPTSRHQGDGLELWDCYVAAVVRCAPPANRPSPEERDSCLPYLAREIALLNRLRVIVALGAFAWDGALRALRQSGISIPRPRPSFAHGEEATVGGFLLIGSYHPSQQNTFTGKLSEESFDEVFERARLALTLSAIT
ncbi:MAG: uracil-DNA glycosylase family protein, partial [Actinomycetota bacterium]